MKSSHLLLQCCRQLTRNPQPPHTPHTVQPPHSMEPRTAWSLNHEPPVQSWHTGHTLQQGSPILGEMEPYFGTLTVTLESALAFKAKLFPA